MGDKSLRGRGCVSRKYATGGAVKPLTAAEKRDANCTPTPREFGEGDASYKARYSAKNKACADAIDETAGINELRKKPVPFAK